MISAEELQESHLCTFPDLLCWQDGEINEQRPGLRELPPRRSPRRRRRGAKLMKPCPQKWMLPRDLGAVGTRGLGAEASRLSRGRAGRRAPVPPAARLSGANREESSKRSTFGVGVPSSTQGGWLEPKRKNRRREGAGAAGDRVLGGEGAVQARTRERILMTRGFEENRMKLPGLLEEDDRG